MDILNDWQDLINAAEDLEINGDPLVVTLGSIDDLKYAVMAMVIYSSRLGAQGVTWGYAMDVIDGQLYVHKINRDSASTLE